MIKKDLRETFAHRLLEAMHHSDVDREDLATLTRGNMSHVSNYLHARCVPRIDLLIQIADLLECSIDYLLGRTDEWKL